MCNQLIHCAWTYSRIIQGFISSCDICCRFWNGSQVMRRRLVWELCEWRINSPHHQKTFWTGIYDIIFIHISFFFALWLNSAKYVSRYRDLSLSVIMTGTSGLRIIGEIQVLLKVLLQFMFLIPKVLSTTKVLLFWCWCWICFIQIHDTKLHDIKLRVRVIMLEQINSKISLISDRDRDRDRDRNRDWQRQRQRQSSSLFPK